MVKLAPDSQNRRPDEEGIKTKTKLKKKREAFVRTVDLMKKGLRLDARAIARGCSRQNRRPDEEGIKTGKKFFTS